MAFDPEAEADLGPVEISPITPAMEQVSQLPGFKIVLFSPPQAIREAMSSNERRVSVQIISMGLVHLEVFTSPQDYNFSWLQVLIEEYNIPITVRLRFFLLQ